VKTVDIIYRYEAGDSLLKPMPGDSDSARLRLDSGNRDFAALLDHVNDESGIIQQIIPVDPRDLGLESGSTGIPKQRPFAAILGCSDARVPIELIFNEGPNDLFVIRVAGNGLGTEVLGSLKYAVEHLGGTLKLIPAIGRPWIMSGSLSARPSGSIWTPEKHRHRRSCSRGIVRIHGHAYRADGRSRHEHHPACDDRHGARPGRLSNAAGQWRCGRRHVDTIRPRRPRASVRHGEARHCQETDLRRIGHLHAVDRPDLGHSRMLGIGRRRWWRRQLFGRQQRGWWRRCAWGYCRATVTAATIGASKTVTIGAAGTAGTARNNAGGNGNDSCITGTSCASASLCTGKGGGGGGFAFNAGGTASGGAGFAGFCRETEFTNQ
jgi:Carbonic anhydrase